MQKVGLKLKYKNTLSEWVDETTSHGIPSIADSSKPVVLRVMWFFFFLGSLAYCIYIIVATIVEYCEFKTSISYEITNELPAVYPAITICNINAFNEERARDYLQSTPLAQYLAAYQCINIEDNSELLKCLNSTTQTNSVLDTLVENLKRYIANDSSISAAQRSIYGFDLDGDMLISCSFSGTPCGAMNFTQYWSNDYGNCYTFNDGKTAEILKISETGNNYGLELELAVNPPDQETVFSYKNGLRVMIHNQSQVPFTLSTGIDIPPGIETYIGVTRTKRVVLEKPYSDCIPDLTTFSSYSQRLFGYFRDLNITYYDQDFCYTLCYQDQLIDECSCADLVSPLIGNAQYCLDDDVFCLFDFKGKFFSSDIGSLCEGVCRQQCEKVDYNLVSHRARYPTYNYMRLLKNNNYSSVYLPKNQTDYRKFARQSLLKLRVNYDRLYYTNINDIQATPLEGFIGNVGGQLGLFIGISLLSLVEIIELGLSLSFVTYAHFKGKKYRY